jgi:hypothetical protein
LYGNPDGTWEVQLPAEEVPPELPEPALGINFARDGMQVRACDFANARGGVRGGANVRTRARARENIVENIARAWRARDAREATGVGAYAKGLGRSAGRSRETLTRDD